MPLLDQLIGWLEGFFFTAAPSCTYAGHGVLLAASGVFIGLMLDLQDGKSIVNGGFDGVYTYFASDAVSYASKTENWARLAKYAISKVLERAAHAAQQQPLQCVMSGPGW